MVQHNLKIMYLYINFTKMPKLIRVCLSCSLWWYIQ